MSLDGLEITHRGTDERGVYKASVPDSDAIGRLTWKKRPGEGDVRIADHTIVPPEIGGRGIAAELVKALIADAREQGFTIVPQCSYVAKKFDENPDWADLRA